MTKRPATVNAKGEARDALHAALDEIEKREHPPTRTELRPILELMDRAFEPRSAARRVVEVLVNTMGGTEA